MTEHTARCYTDRRDTVTATVDSNAVWLEPSGVAVGMQPDDARTFARGILALADEVDGGEKEEATPAVSVGDRIRIITTGSRGAMVKAGEIYTVRKVTEYEVQVDGDGANGRWYLSPDDVEKIEEADEPAAPLAEKGPTLPTRAELLSQARDLMSGSQTYTALDLTELADYLAGEK